VPVRELQVKVGIIAPVYNKHKSLTGDAKLTLIPEEDRNDVSADYEAGSGNDHYPVPIHKVMITASEVTSIMSYQTCHEKLTFWRQHRLDCR
jgi:hypothetical protein